MHDLQFVRANLALVEEKLRARGQDPAALLGNFTRLDAERRERITEAETLKARRNALSEEVGRKKRAKEDATALMEETRQIKEKLEALDASATALDDELRGILANIPNLPHDSVPAGTSEHDNVEQKQWGTKPQFDFTPRPHWELGEALGILDLERAAKLSGARFAVYWDQGARLERALANFMLDIHTREHGYREVMPPVMVNSRSLFGTGQLPKFADDLFRCVDAEGFTPGQYRENDHWLIPTAEVPVTNLYRDEVLDEAALSISLTAYTPCFRSEAGSYGKDVRGIIRQHQFQKVELVKFTRPEDSEAEHEKLTRDAESDSRTAQPALSPRAAVCRRYGLFRIQDIRPRSVAAGPGALSRDLFLQQLRKLSGAACEYSLPSAGEEQDGVRPYPEWQRPGQSGAPGWRFWRTISRPTGRYGCRTRWWLTWVETRKIERRGSNAQ